MGRLFTHPHMIGLSKHALAPCRHKNAALGKAICGPTTNIRWLGMMRLYCAPDTSGSSVFTLSYVCPGLEAGKYFFADGD